MKVSELKYQYEEHNPNGHFFDRKTMKFFGDTMRNYGVRSAVIDTYDHKNMDVISRMSPEYGFECPNCHEKNGGPA